MDFKKLLHLDMVNKVLFKKVLSKILAFLCCLAALFICVLPVLLWYELVPLDNYKSDPYIESVIEDDEDIEEGGGYNVLVRRGNLLSRPEPKRPDRFLELFGQPEFRKFVIGYFAEICGSAEVAEIILTHSEAYDLPPALTFALAWEESHFNPKAINSGNQDGSVDRGLFQLNNRSFPHLEPDEFFNPDINAHHGIRHLSTAIESVSSEFVGLAVYNAGLGRVKNGGTPMRTLIYISRIMENKKRIENHFHEWEFSILDAIEDIIDDDVQVEAPEEKTEERHHFNLIPLLPLGVPGH
jgi:hypothetical protein